MDKKDIKMSFTKHGKNPLYGNAVLGTMFDVYMTKINGKYRMDVSWRKEKAVAVAFSEDGLDFTLPQKTLTANPESGWEDDLNRNCVLFVDGVYKMWYTGQANGHSYIGYAESADGVSFERKSATPILSPELDFEGESVMNPCVLYENGIYRMWYSAGETYEPNVICYAESKDGISFKKADYNPILSCDKSNFYEQDRIGGCQVIKTDDMGYLIFYIGYSDIDTACICCAKSEDGISNWVRSPLNPLVYPTKGEWDGDACYKPTAIFEDGKWRIWYNGRLETNEYIGLAEYEGRSLF